MSQRVIACQVVGEYVTGDGVVIGAVGTHDGVLIELDFTADSSGLWEGTTKTVTFTDALGQNPVNILLTADLLAEGQADVYQVPVPQAAIAVAGMMGMSVAGVIVSGTTESIRVTTELSQFRVLENHAKRWDGDIDVPASAAEQLQAQIDAVLPKFVQLDDSVAEAAASAAASAGSAVLSESWAVGHTGARTGEDTNNAKYWSEQAQAAAWKLNSIGITRGPEKVIYAPGDTFDPTGMEVVANFLSGSGSIPGVEISGYTYPTSALTAGTTSVTISYTAGGVTKTASVPITVLNIGATLNATAWSVIKQVSDMDLGDNFWDVGDTKSITLNGKVGAHTFNQYPVQAFIIGFNHNSAKEGAHRIHFLLGKISSKNVAFCDSKYNNSGSDAAFRMNTTNTNAGGWSSSYMRGTILKSGTNPTSPGSNNMLAAMPSDLRAVMKAVTKYTDNTGNQSTASSAVTATTDYLFLLAEFEVFGVRSYANPYEQNSQEQYAYFATNNTTYDRLAYNHTDVSTSVWWWLRSPGSGNSDNFVYVFAVGLTSEADRSGGLRAGFAV